MPETLHCWKCGTPLLSIPLPIGRRDECPSCGADLHVCRMCAFHDPAASKECREPMADEVEEKERGNFCDYFRATGGAGPSQESAEANAARAKLGALFGDATGAGRPGSLAQQAAAIKSKARDDAAAARAMLDKLFGGKGEKGKP